jgi:hypothetical protein
MSAYSRPIRKDTRSARTRYPRRYLLLWTTRGLEICRPAVLPELVTLDIDFGPKPLILLSGRSEPQTAAGDDGDRDLQNR